MWWEGFSASGEQGEVPSGAVALGGYGTLSRNNVWRFKMKMVKSLLLGSAAGLVAIAGAQAADLPVKAKPVQYVKICSLYGVGFYYIPGTDMCLKVGGWARAEYTWGANGSIATGPFNQNINSRSTNNSAWRARGYITVDARNQTEYGTVRGYLAIGLNTTNVGADSASNTFSANRAFIQWAGFTFGLAQSFYDFYSVPATSYWGSFPASDTGDPGWMVAGYTAQFGNGFSASLAAEMRRNTVIADTNGSVINAFTGPSSSYGGFQAPDVVGNLRVDQAWGSAQIMAAGHQVNALYYGTGESTGHPDDKWGFAVGAGLKLNAPMIGQGDYLQTQVNYSEGALRYVFFTPNQNFFYREGAEAAYGNLTDGVYGGAIGTTASSLELTTAWGVNAAYEHFWNPRWRTSLYGGYAAVSYNDSGNAMLCTSQGFGAGGAGTAAIAGAGCDNDWSTWWIGSRTQWNVTKDFYMGVDVLYQKLQTASPATGVVLGSPSSVILAPTSVTDQDNWQFRFRVHRDFYP
jgi:hypothetical protein